MPQISLGVNKKVLSVEQMLTLSTQFQSLKAVGEGFESSEIIYGTLFVNNCKLRSYEGPTFSRTTLGYYNTYEFEKARFSPKASSVR